MAPAQRPAIAFCDLDGTVTYPAILATGRWSDPRGLITVERAAGRPTTVMTRGAGPVWTALVAADALVPATTRTTEQYAALVLPGRRPRIAITGNGGDILRDGQPEPAWRRRVEQFLAATAAPFDQLAAILGSLTDGSAVLGRPFPADRLYFILGSRTPSFPDDLLVELAEVTRPLGWRAVASGRRAYVLPALLDKHLAVDRVAAERGADVIVAAGDSDLDAQMLAFATAAIRPPHGGLEQAGWTAPHCTVATAPGLAAGQEILEWLTTRVRGAHHDASARWARGGQRGRLASA
jgi:hypothetical protein